MSPITSKLGVSTPHVEGTVIGGETLTLSVTSGTLAGGHSATVPSGTTRILCVPAATTHWANNATATTSFGYSQTAGQAFVIEPEQISSAQVRAASGTPTMVAVYFGNVSNLRNPNLP
jgi:hypothetical protein